MENQFIGGKIMKIKTLKKGMAVTMAATMMFGLTACGESATETTPASIVLEPFKIKPKETPYNTNVPIFQNISMIGPLSSFLLTMLHHV